MRRALVAVCWLSLWNAAQADPASSVTANIPATPIDVPHTSAVLRYGNPHAPIVIEVSDVARRGAVVFASGTLVPLVDKFPGLVSLQWTITSRGTPSDDRTASALLEAAAQAGPWCYVRALAQGGSAEEIQSDQFGKPTLLAAAASCRLDVEKSKRAMERRLYSTSVPRHPPDARALQRITIGGVTVTRNITSEVGDLAERLARGQVLRPVDATRQPLFGRSRNAYERPALNALPPAAPAAITLARAARGGIALIDPAQPQWDIQVFCALDTICQGLLGELARLAASSAATPMRVRWTPLQATTTSDATFAVVCAALAGTSPTILMHLVATAASSEHDGLCANQAQFEQAQQTTQAYTALAQAQGIRHDLTLVINGRLFAGGLAPGSLREMLAEDTNMGVMERLAPWLR